MPRTNVKLALIEDNKARKIAFMKRKETLKKKLNELCILCDVEACIILYSSYEPELEFWPKDKVIIQNVLDQFLGKQPMEKSKNMTNQVSYLKGRIKKANEKLNKLKMVNQEIVQAKMMSDCLSGKVSVADLNSTDLNELMSLARLKISEIDEISEFHKGDSPQVAPAPEAQQPQPQDVVGGSSTTNNLAAEGADVDPYVPVMRNPGTLDDAENVEWYLPLPDCPSNQLEDGLDLVSRVDMMTSFLNDPNSSWSDAFFPKKF
ncbi:agamous-like MADS-box protein AGL36 [Bidens hawaiensis]|uniref:agamous-like MADS-box protein AGL36 n=1 Tax=Bidens hawaiensis TaxID=980011 RepID=UPI00404B5C31